MLRKRIASAVTLLALVASTHAFTPVGRHNQHERSTRPHLVKLDMAETEKRSSKRQGALQTLRRVAVPMVYATLGVASAAQAAAATSITSYRRLVGGTIGAGTILSALWRGIQRSSMDAPATGVTRDKMRQAFPGAITNESLVQKVATALTKYQYNSDNTLLVTSLGTNAVCRSLESEFATTFGDAYAMGGLAGFPFGGVSSFDHMASHTPDDGSCLIVFGPHMGIDGNGEIGTVEQWGRAAAGPCCASAVAASDFALRVYRGQTDAPKRVPENLLDAQQEFVQSLLIPHAARLDKAPEPLVELPYLLYDLQKEMITDIVKMGAGSLSKQGKIAVLGGIQVVTSPGLCDYYLPLSLEVYDNTGTKLDDLKL